jgi:hypothetical protein
MRGWEDNIKTELEKILWKRVDWMRLPQDEAEVSGCCEHGKEPSGSIKGGEFLD